MTQLQKAPWSEWETVQLIGRGSFGTVYEIQRKLANGDTESAALKVITIPQNPGDVEELYNEGYDEESITATFNAHLKSIVSEYALMQKMEGSANIVNCKDIRYIQHDNGLGWDIYIRMELLTPLTKALPADISEDLVVKIGKDLCNALVLCKKHEIIHRDIKPQNIFVSANGDYKLGDFGIAKIVEKTMGGTKIGTYKYMAPEVYNNQPYGSAADIYSLGLVLYWLLNERRMPFMPLPPAKLTAGQDEQARYRRLSGEKLPAPAHGSEELQQIVLKACAYDPKDRYTSAAAMLNALSSLGSNAIVPGAVLLDSDAAPTELDPDGTACLDSCDTEKTALVNPENTTTEVQAEPDCDNTQFLEETATLEGTGTAVLPEAVAPQAFMEAPSFAVNPPKSDNSYTPAAEQPCDFRYQQQKKESAGKIIRPMLVILLAIALIILLLVLRSCAEEKTGVRPSNISQITQPEEWSAWVDNLPINVSADTYEIEEQVLYSSRTLETTTSTEHNTLPGWELYDTVNANGGYGPWSDWSTSAVYESGSREVETKTQYRYRTKNYTISSKSSLSGWTLYDTSTSYGSWSSWSDTPVSGSSTREVQTRPVQTGTRYFMAHYCTGKTGDEYQYKSSNRKYSNQCSYHELGWFSSLDDFYPQADGGYLYQSSSTSSCYRCSNTCYRFYILDTENTYKTQYRYRSISKTNYFYQWSDWSDYGDASVSGNSDREVSTQMLYRYRDQAKTTTYYFRQWTDWSVYSENPVTATETKQVQTKTQYRYKKK